MLKIIVEFQNSLRSIVYFCSVWPKNNIFYLNVSVTGNLVISTLFGIIMGYGTALQIDEN